MEHCLIVRRRKTTVRVIEQEEEVVEFSLKRRKVQMKHELPNPTFVVLYSMNGGQEEERVLSIQHNLTFRLTGMPKFGVRVVNMIELLIPSRNEIETTAES